MKLVSTTYRSRVLVVGLVTLGHTAVMARKRKVAYTVVIEEEPPGSWHAYAPAVRGCFAGGRTRSEALRRYRSALRLHLDELAARGAALPTERHAAAVQVVVAA